MPMVNFVVSVDNWTVLMPLKTINRILEPTQPLLAVISTVLCRSNLMFRIHPECVPEHGQNLFQLCSC